ncbi:hypothetical protein GQ600_2071 [Phytophthora cactorum]|nr:hypothetical protein GQ600_2071 [Phytophthora cactorum]
MQAWYGCYNTGDLLVALLDSVQAREEAVDKILAVLTKVESPQQRRMKQFIAFWGPAECSCVIEEASTSSYQLRYREQCCYYISEYIGANTGGTLAENQLWSSPLREEALKCMINSVYSRPEFVSETLVAKGFVTRFLSLAKLEDTVSLHWLVWKVLLVSCESSEIPRHVSSSLEAWQLIYTVT